MPKLEANHDQQIRSSPRSPSQNTRDTNSSKVEKYNLKMDFWVAIVIISSVLLGFLDQALVSDDYHVPVLGSSVTSFETSACE